MSKRRRGAATLGGAKGGDLLRALADKLKPAAPPSRPSLSADERLLAAFQQRQPPSPGPKTTPARRKEPKKQILRVPPGQKAVMIAAAEQVAPASTISASPKAPSSDAGKAAFQRIAMLRSTLEILQASHNGRDSLSPDCREAINRRIALGAEKLRQIVAPHDGHFMGHDFGTSASKAVLRDPYRVGKAFAVPVPIEWASGSLPHLWPTALWYDVESGRFSPLPEGGWRCLHGFKSAIIEGLGHRNCCGTVPMEQAAAAFIAFHVAYAVGAALERDPSFKIAGINMSVPVAALANGRTRDMFENVVKTGLSLVEFAPSLTRAMVQAAGAEPRTSIPYTLHTELSGAIAGYCAAPRYYLGGHMIIDCGSATLDMATFTLEKPDWPIGIYSARVEPLGADACITYQTREATVEDCRSAARYQEHQVFRETLDYRRIGFQQDGEKCPYQVILIGGGIHSEVHKPLFKRMEGAFYRAFHRPELARDLDYERGSEAGRLILADGLARDPIDLREVAMPGDQPPPKPLGRYPDPITKDQV